MKLVHNIILAYKNLNKIDYTCEYTQKAKDSRKSSFEILSSDEHSRLSEIDFSEYFSSREKLINWYFNYLDNINQVDVISVIGEKIKAACNVDSEEKHKIKIVSFGSGPSVIEFFLKSIYQNRVEIFCCDYDNFMMKACESLFNNMSFCCFNFYQEDYEKISCFNPDIAILIGSGCSMDNKQYILFLKKLHMLGIKDIFCFEAGIYTSVKYLYRNLLKIGRAVFLGENNHTYHAYARTPTKIKLIYKKSGFKFDRIKGMRSFKFAYHLY